MNVQFVPNKHNYFPIPIQEILKSQVAGKPHSRKTRITNPLTVEYSKAVSLQGRLFHVTTCSGTCIPSLLLKVQTFIYDEHEGIFPNELLKARFRDQVMPFSNKFKNK